MVSSSIAFILLVGTIGIGFLFIARAGQSTGQSSIEDPAESSDTIAVNQSLLS